MGVLEQRLRDRGTDSEAQIEGRLATARRELEVVDLFDYVVVNDELRVAVREVCEVIEAERSRETRAVREQHGRERVLKRWRESVDYS